MNEKLTWGSNETFGELKQNKEVPEEVGQETVNIPVVENTVVATVPASDSNKVHPVIFNNPFIKVKTSGKFIYAERKGVDSVAFILLATNASDERRIGLINEYKPPVSAFLTTAFGGSIDKEYKDNLKKLVINEVIEEAGFVVTEEQIKDYGKVFVSSQMNQFCHLFAVEVDKTKQGDATTTDLLEMQSSVVWMTLPDALKIEDWKAVTIIAKRLATKDSYAIVRTGQK